MDFQKRLRELREGQRYSQAELAERIGLSQSQIGQMEIGKRMPSIETAILLSDFFGVSLDYLFGDAPTRDGYRVDENGFKIKTPPELEDVGVESVVKTDNLPFTPEQVQEIQKMLNDHLRELEKKG